MNKSYEVVFLVVVIAILGAMGVTTALMNATEVHATANCHNNKGSTGCPGNGEKAFICNKIFCRATGDPN